MFIHLSNHSSYFRSPRAPKITLINLVPEIYNPQVVVTLELVHAVPAHLAVLRKQIGVVLQ